MKKVCLIILSTIFSSAIVSAQAPLGKGGVQLNAGLGFSDWGTPVYAGLDIGVHPDITIGPRVSFRNYNYRAGGTKWEQNLTVLGFNGNYHFNKLLNLPKQWNVYAGLTVGYYIWGSSDFSGAKTSSPGLDAQIGARYFFSKNFGVNLEFGGGMTTGGGLGITYRFK